MELVQAAPQEPHVVAGAVIDVDEAAQDEIADDGAAEDAEIRSVHPAVRRHPVLGKREWHHGADGGDEYQESDPDPGPSLAGRELARRPDPLGDEEHEVGERGRESDHVDGIHGISFRGLPYGVSRLQHYTLTA